jgi:hypothetical protein
MAPTMGSYRKFPDEHLRLQGFLNLSDAGVRFAMWLRD